MSARYSYATRKGTFHIVTRQGKWHIYFDGDNIDGPFPSPQAAAEAVSAGTCAWPDFGDPSELGIPDDISDWRSSRS